MSAARLDAGRAAALDALARGSFKATHPLLQGGGISRKVSLPPGDDFTLSSEHKPRGWMRTEHLPG